MTIRAATPADALPIAQVQTRSWRAAYVGVVPQAVLDGLSVERRRRGWARILAGEVHVVVAEVDGAVRGFAAVGSSHDEGAAGATGELSALYVDPDAWRRGVGRDLLHEAERVLRERGCVDAGLWVLRDNASGRAFYGSAGWTPTGGTSTLDLDGAPVEEVRYRRVLRA